jgi:hypothetical protein
MRLDVNQRTGSDLPKSNLLAFGHAAMWDFIGATWFGQDCAQCLVWTERSAALQAHTTGRVVDLFEFIILRVLWNIDGLGDRIIDKRLQCRLHPDMGSDQQFAGGDKGGRQSSL